MKPVCTRVAIGAFALALFAIPAVAVYVTVTDLGTAGSLESYAYRINNAGQVLGQLYFQATAHAFFWESGAMTDLGTLGGSNTSSYPSTFNKGMNKFGQVVGNSQIDGGAQHAFLWQKTTGMIDLGTLAGGFVSEADAINDSGQIVGVASDSMGKSHAVLWQNGTIIDLGSLVTSGASGATSINNSGQIVGWSEIAPGGPQHAFLWTGAMTDLGVLPGNNNSYAADINDAGQIIGTGCNFQAVYHCVSDFKGFIWQDGAFTYLAGFPVALNALGQVAGYSFTPSGYYHASLWQNGLMTDLGTLGGNYSNATGINDSGQIVGSASDSSGNSPPFVWQNGSMTSLGTLGGGYAHANFSINNFGQVVGSSVPPGGGFHAALWTTLAAPPTFTLTAAAGPGGSISPGGATTVTIGTTQTFKITPNKYYHIADVVVDGSSVGAVTGYTFSNVTEDHTISATFIPVDFAVTMPNNGSVWQMGTDQTITWSYINDPGKIVKLELLTWEGTFVDTINNGVPVGKNGSGSYKWHVSSKLVRFVYKVRVTSLTNSQYTETSDGFLVTN